MPKENAMQSDQNGLQGERFRRSTTPHLIITYTATSDWLSVRRWPWLASKWTKPSSMHRNEVKNRAFSSSARTSLCCGAPTKTRAWLPNARRAPATPATFGTRRCLKWCPLRSAKESFFKQISQLLRRRTYAIPHVEDDVKGAIRYPHGHQENPAEFGHLLARHRPTLGQ